MHPASLPPRPRGSGYWTGIPKRIDAPLSISRPGEKPKRVDQLPNIKKLAMELHQADDPALWDETFFKRFGLSVKDCIEQHCSPERFQFLSEVIPRGHPCKLFIDVEFYKDFNPARLVHEDTRAMAERLTQIVAELIPDSEQDVIVLYACLPEKGSVHLTWQVVFKSVEHVKAFVLHHLLPRIESNAADKALFAVNKHDDQTKGLIVVSAIDKAVYVAERLFRTYGAEKQSMNNPLLPWKTRLSQLDPRVFSLALVAVVACHPDDVAVVRAHPELQHVLCTDKVWQVAEAEKPKPGIKRLKLAEPSSKATASLTCATTVPVSRSAFPKAEQHLDNLFVKCPLISKQARCTGKIDADEKGTPWAQKINWVPLSGSFTTRRSTKSMLRLWRLLPNECKLVTRSWKQKSSRKSFQTSFTGALCTSENTS